MKKAARKAPSPSASPSSLEIRSSSSEESEEEDTLEVRMGKELEALLMEGGEEDSRVGSKDPPRVEVGATPTTKEEAVIRPEPAGVQGAEPEGPSSPVIGVVVTEVRALTSATPAQTSGEDIEEYLRMYEFLGDPVILPQILDGGKLSIFIF
ncbi:hypothetical protein GUJ93_ZPchr0015g6808 [Zizania palustris]|uniref:Uncharacterized protein n=1 Tax=Zizania palustris TaxID=103762 RepID=A0A8J5TM01_ZIZPA|nr:hypothetical protein GUJ93_ZPchr0015g6808 [Zizania palustris]